MSDRMKKAASSNREEALLHRIAGNDTTADRLEARADALDSGKVADRTDDVIGLFRGAFRR
jgi:hypothetical protein